jgi:hypothetical protein
MDALVAGVRDGSERDDETSEAELASSAPRLSTLRARQ